MWCSRRNVRRGWRALASGRTSGRRPARTGRQHVIRHQLGVGKITIGQVEEILHIGRVGVHLFGRGVVKRVRRADDRAVVAPRQAKDHAAIFLHHHGVTQRQARGVDHQMHALTGRQNRWLAGQFAQLIGPRPGGIDDHLGADGRGGFGVEAAVGIGGDFHARHPLAFPQQLGHTRAIDDGGAEGPRVDGVLQRHARVVGGAVVIEEPTLELLAQERRLQLVDATGAHGAVQLGRAEFGKAVINPQADVEDEQPRAIALVDRHQEFERPDQVRRQLHQERPLVGALEHQPELRVLEVAQAAVHQLRRFGRRSRREIGFLDERDFQAAQRRVAGDAGAGDAAADDQEIERLFAEAFERGLSLGARGRFSHGCRCFAGRRAPPRRARRAGRCRRRSARRS